MATDKFLLLIQGPTASGKSDLALSMAELLQTGIISADARQFYRGFDIGTAKPTAAELARVPHHFINTLEPDQTYTAGMYERDALQLIEDRFEEKDILLMAGGSGFYVKALTDGLDDIPEASPKLRAELMQQLDVGGFEPLQQQLKELDPKAYTQIDLSNPHRLLRALEVCISTGKPFSAFKRSTPKERPFRLINCAIQIEREANYRRINERVDAMMEAGLLAEVESLLPYRECQSFRTVGYREFLPYFDGQIPLEQAVADVKTASRRYAKRQMTWLRRERGIHWIPFGQELPLRRLVESETGIAC